MAATEEPGAAVGPVPFKDGTGAAVPLPAISTITSRPSDPKLWVRYYQGTWVLDIHLPGVVSIHQGSLTPRRGDVILASPPKCGTTWLKALAFATMARGVYPPAPAPGCHAEHPLLRLNPHDCVPFLEMLFSAGQGSKMEALPSPRLMATHMHHSLLPASISNNPDCKIVYICREPKDMLVSLWHFARRMDLSDTSFSDVLEAACEGMSVNGPFWDHVLGYWNASKASPETVLFLRYEEMLRDPVGSVKKLAHFVGQPFSPAEEEAGVVTDIVRLCSFDKMKNLEVNKAGSRAPLGNDRYFRKGRVGDWVNYMTPDMARRLDAIVEEKLRGSGLSFSTL